MLLDLFEAIIFDCDGVIVDSEALSCGAWNVVFERKFGIDIGTDYTHILGKNSRDTVIHFLKKHDLPINEEIIQELSELKEQVYFELAEGKLQPIPDVETFLRFCRSKGLKIAVASSGTREKILFNLKQVNLLHYFDIIIGTNHHIRGKPHPDVFLEAARQLAVKPTRCMVIEDTPSGIMAAKAAGMFTIALTTTFSFDDLQQANYTASSYKQLIEWIKNQSL